MKTIAVVRANAVGDFFFCLPALYALKEGFPGAKITYFGRSWHSLFLSNRPSPIDELIEVPFDVGSYRPTTSEAADAFVNKFANRNWDLAIQMHGGGKGSNHFVRALGAKKTVGSRAESAAPLSEWIKYQTFQNEMMRYLEIAQLTGLSNPSLSLKLHLEVTRDDKLEFDQALGFHLAYFKINNFLFIHPGAKDPRRRWPSDSFARLCEWVLSWTKLDILLNAGPGEEELAERIKSAAKVSSDERERRITIPKNLGLRGLYYALSKARLVVSNDSGPFHMAHALGVANLGLFWGPNLVTAAPPIRHNTEVLTSWQMHCTQCGHVFFSNGVDYDPCPHEVSLLSQISVDRVVSTVHEKLNRSTGHDSYSI